MKYSVRLLFTLIVVGLACAIPEAADAAEVSGAAASDPTAAVNYQDFRYRYVDVDVDNDRERHSFETEGAFMLRPFLKITNELRYVSDDRSGSSEQDFNQLKVKGIYLREIKPFGIKAKLALGAERQELYRYPSAIFPFDVLRYDKRLPYSHYGQLGPCQRGALPGIVRRSST